MPPPTVRNFGPVSADRQLRMVPLDTPGITMLPLHNIAGGQQNQTFFDNVRVLGRGWIGADKHGHHLAAVRGGAESFLAIDDPMVAVTRRARGQRR